MNIGMLPELILSWLKNQGGELLGADKGSPLQGKFQLGQQYEGQVLENLPNGRSLVQVAEQKLDMALPQQARPGDVIRLTYVQSGPRPTFIMNSAPTASAQPVSVSQAAQQVSALSRLPPPASGSPVAEVVTPQSAPAALANVPASSTVTVQSRPIIADPATLLASTPNTAASANTASMARTVNTIMATLLPATPPTDEAVGGANASVATNPGLASAKGIAPEAVPGEQLLAIRLQQTVKESGVFYESHLGKWVRGEINLDTVLREPQAKLAQTPGPLLNLPDLDGMPEKAANMANRQLAMLEGGPFVWQGQAWPGQNMEWQVTERDTGDQAYVEEAQKWHSKLRLTLPRLGGVVADLDVGALGLRIRLSSQTPETVNEMQANLSALGQRMKTAELNLTSLQVGLSDGGA